MRGVVCKASLEQLHQLEVRGKRMKRRLARLRKHYIEKALKTERRQHILNMMEQESSRWLHWDNVDEGLRNSVLIPNNLQYQTDYFVKLQERAVLLSLGKYDDVEESKVEHRVIQFKNSKLVPVYANLTGLLSRLRSSDLDRMYEEYELAMYGLKEAGYSAEELTREEAKLGECYELLIMKLKRDMNKPAVKLRLLEEKLLVIFNVLLLWREYTTLLNMTYEEFQGLMNQDSQMYIN